MSLDDLNRGELVPPKALGKLMERRETNIFVAHMSLISPGFPGSHLQLAKYGSTSSYRRRLGPWSGHCMVISWVSNGFQY